MARVEQLTIEGHLVSTTNMGGLANAREGLCSKAIQWLEWLSTNRLTVAQPNFNQSYTVLRTLYVGTLLCK